MALKKTGLRERSSKHVLAYI